MDECEPLLGGATLLVTEPTIRCPATEVNPESAARDMQRPADPPGRAVQADVIKSRVESAYGF